MGVGVPGGSKDPLGDADCQGVLLADAVGQGVGGIQEGVWFVEFGDQASIQGFLGVEDTPGHEDFQGQGFIHKFLKPPEATGGCNNAQVRFWLAHLDVGGAQAEVCGVGQFSTATQGIAVNGGNDGHGEPMNTIKNLGVNPAQGVLPAAFPQLGNICAGGKDTAAVYLAAGQDKDFGRGFEIGAKLVEFCNHGGVNSIAHLGAVHAH